MDTPTIHAAIQCQSSGRFQEAAAICRAMLHQQPNNAQAAHVLGLALQQLGSFDESIAAFRQSLVAKPDSPEVLLNLGNTFKLKGDFEQAIVEYRRAIALRPGYAEAMHSLASVLALVGRIDEAIDGYRQVLASSPGFARTYLELGNALSASGKVDEAISVLRRGLALDVNDPEFHCALAVTLLKKGEYTEGWAQHEWRWRHKDFVRRENPPPGARWDGEKIAGRRILLHAEQGFGDTIQFARYIPLVAQRGAKVLYTGPKELDRLIRNMPGIEKMISNPTAEAYDLCCPLMSLAFAFDTTLQTIPAPARYLAPEQQLAEQWKKRIGPRTNRLRVGIAWAASREAYNFHNRSVPIEQIAKLAATGGVEFFSVQKCDPELRAKIDSAKLPRIDWTGQLADFADTAALIDQLDLIISIDSAVGHLAGALGKPVWLLLRFAADWRWLMDRQDSPWYPTMRLFRQPATGDWQTPIGQIIEALHESKHSIIGAAADAP